LLDWTNPGGAGSLTEWKNKVARPLREGQSHDANNKQLARARVPSTPGTPVLIFYPTNAYSASQNNSKITFYHSSSYDGISTQTVPNISTKTLIADQLPTKTDKVVFCPLTETQKQAYENLMECEDIELIKRRSEPCDCFKYPKLTRGACCYSVNREGISIEALIFPYPSSPNTVSVFVRC
jgi:DNA excision repair protein ERCC-6-like 2